MPAKPTIIGRPQRFTPSISTKPNVAGEQAAQASPAGGTVQYLCVGEEQAGQRLDNFLMRLLKGVPKSHIYQCIRSGQVRVNQGRAVANTRLCVNDQVRIPPVRTAQKQKPLPNPMANFKHPKAFPALSVLLEDEYLLALEKPAGTAVHGGSGIALGMIEQLRLARPESPFLELVHRLDKETSGILLVAKKRAALLHLQNQLREHRMKKIYQALVIGHWPKEKQRIDVPLYKYLLPHGERRVRATHAQDPLGKAALTWVQVKQHMCTPQGLALSLLKVRLQTGRTHQIRVHLAHHQHPIAGDEKYGNEVHNQSLQAQGLNRMFLHAGELSFTHPHSQAPVHLVAPLPEALTQFLKDLSTA